MKNIQKFLVICFLLIIAILGNGGHAGFGANSLPEAAWIVQSVASYDSAGGLNISPAAQDNIFAAIFWNYVPYLSDAPYYSSIFIYNVSTAQSANLTLYFYQADNPSAVLVYVDPQPLPANATRAYDLWTLPGLPDGFLGCAVVSSNTETRVIVHLDGIDTTAAMMYSGTISAATAYYAPRISRNSQGKTTEIAVQNPTSSGNTISIEFTPVESGSHAVISYLIAAYTTHVFALDDLPGLGSAFSGYARVTGSAGIAMVVVEKDSAGDQSSATNGIPAGGNNVYSPLQQKNLNGWSTVTRILNTADHGETLTVEFYDTAGNLVWSDNPFINSNQLVEYDLASNPYLPYDFDGSLELSSTVPLAVQTNLIRSTDSVHDTYAASRAMDSASSANALMLPYAIHLKDTVETEISIKNIANSGPPISFDVYFSDKPEANLAGLTIPAHGVYRLDTRAVANLGDSWSGSVRIAATGPIVGEVSVQQGIMTSIQVGVVLPTRAEPRWLQDESQFIDQFTSAGYTVSVLFSQGDTAVEKTNVETLISQGIDVLILTPQDACAAAAAVEEARAAGVKVISHDRLIRCTDAVDFYITFDSIGVGEAQGQYLADHATGNNNPLYLYAGAASDNNAFLFFEGAWNKLQPKIAAGAFEIENSSEAVNLQNKPALTRDEMAYIISQITTNWDYNTARNLAEANLATATAAGKGHVFILGPNDDTARAIADVFRTDPQVFTYVITGQDAEKDSVQYILDGKQSMTVFKDVRTLVSDAVSTAITYLQGGTPVATTSYNNGVIDVPAKPSEVVVVDKSNVMSVLIDSGYYQYDDFAWPKYQYLPVVNR